MCGGFREVALRLHLTLLLLALRSVAGIVPLQETDRSGYSALLMTT